MSGQLAADTDVAFARLEAVDGTDVVEAAASHEVAGRRVGARHHPARAQRDRVQLQHTTAATVHVRLRHRKKTISERGWSSSSGERAEEGDVGRGSDEMRADEMR